MLRAQKTGLLLPGLTDDVLNVQKSHTMLRQVPFGFQIYTIHPDNIKTVLATSFKDYSLGYREKALGQLFGSGIFTLSGDGWKHSRAMLRPQFAREQVSRLNSVSHHAGVLIESIDRDQKDKQFIDMQYYFHLLTMDTATEFLFGSSIKSLNTSAISQGTEIVTKSGERITSAEFVESYTFLNDYGMRRMLLTNFYWAMNSAESKFHKRRAHLFIDFYVDKALAATAPENMDKISEDTYIFAFELAKVTRDPIVIRDQIFNILIAGRDTTASTMSYMVYYLARDKRVLDKLRTEILENFGTAEQDQPITYESLRQSRYLNFVINEVLRIAPVVPLNLRQAVRDTVLPVGGGPNEDQPIFIPKGMVVSYMVYVMHRNPELWGDDADQFVPERWEEQRLPSNPWAYLPFNGGPRICLGQQFALTEIALTMVKLLQRYSQIEKGPEFPDEPMWKNTLTLQHMNGVVVRMVK